MPGWRSLTEKVRLHHTFEPRRRALRYILRPGMVLSSAVAEPVPVCAEIGEVMDRGRGLCAAGDRHEGRCTGGRGSGGVLLADRRSLAGASMGARRGGACERDVRLDLDLVG